MKKELENKRKAMRRAARVRKQIAGGTAVRPRLSIFRSNRSMSAQLIDDAARRTIASASSLELEKKVKRTKIEAAREVGKLIAERAKKEGIEQALFDRGSYRYHGRVKALAEAAREAKLKI